MIYTRLISGLGNQLFQYAVGRQLALDRHTGLKLDVSFFDSQNLRSYKLHHYNIKAQVAIKEEVDKLLKPYFDNSLYYKVYRRVVNLLPKHEKGYFKEAEWWTYEPGLYKVCSNALIDGYWQHYRYFENLRPEILEELTLKDSCGAIAEKLLKDIITDPASISLHIRRGDYITDKAANALMGILPIDYYLKGIEFVRNLYPDASLYVFSDDLNWAESNLKSKLPKVFVDIENGTRDYVELELMRNCKHNIIANSSFSWWGAFLNQNKNKTVIAPKKWVVPEQINNRINIQFPTWNRM